MQRSCGASASPSSSSAPSPAPNRVLPVALPRTSHRIVLGEAVDGERALVHAWQAAERDVLVRLVHNVLVDLVRQHHEARMLPYHFGNRLQLLARVHRAGGVGRTAQNEHARARRERRPQLLR
eukprot:366417-Chlamydomonas_euryale.AAC.14